jgi:hypothetical protein
MSDFIPMNELDRAIKAMARSQAAFPDFCRALCKDELWALIPFHPEIEGEMLEIKNGAPFPFALLREEKGDAVPVFSSEERADEGLAKGRVPARKYSVCTMPAMQLLEILGSTKFGAVINKGCATGSITIWPDLMRDLANGEALRVTGVNKTGREHFKLDILNPANYPTEMVQRAFEFMRRHGNFRAAWVFGKKSSGLPRYQLLILMDPREDVIFHDLNLTVHVCHTKTYETDMGLLDEKDPAYIESLFRQAAPFYVAADYQRPPGAKV